VTSDARSWNASDACTSTDAHLHGRVPSREAWARGGTGRGAKATVAGEPPRSCHKGAAGARQTSHTRMKSCAGILACSRGKRDQGTLLRGNVGVWPDWRGPVKVRAGRCRHMRKQVSPGRGEHGPMSMWRSSRQGQPLPSTLSSVAGGAKRRGAHLTPLLGLGRAGLCRSREWWSPRRPPTLAPIVHCEPISGTSARGRCRLARNSREICHTLPTRTRRHAAQRQAFDPPFRLADGCPGPRHRAPTAVWRVCLSNPKCAPGPP